ncbi:MAG: hypothetical protein N4J56_006287 [Chroococcidiopsis sp. SAG 2025]|uniref:hypothetical protein n=1 Tax=Chroococcidiopsis sp. SAG 2025 TaxID=171389 RepID=UPI002937323F|nr:hypothetical protein [Chroococcidiopsis sp. SAG 2025]MDV2996633.1 hypothetical protein [Chroococcidiopsis sp. SAG 2025]
MCFYSFTVSDRAIPAETVAGRSRSRTAPSTETCINIQGELRRLSFAGSSVWVSPVAFSPVDIELVVNVPQLSQGYSDKIAGAIASLLSPTQHALGSSIRVKELEYLVRSLQGVTEVVTLLVNNQAVNLAMPNKYTTPKLEGVTVVQVDPQGRSATYHTGTGFGNPD